MKLAKIMLWYTTAIWVGYGLWLFIDPKALAYMGYGLDNWSAIVEVQAMYGTAEIALGIFALLGVLRPKRFMIPALTLWAMIYTALVIGRIVGIIQWGGTFAVQFGVLPDSYNPGAMWFLELPSATLLWLSLYLLRDNAEVN